MSTPMRLLIEKILRMPESNIKGFLHITGGAYVEQERRSMIDFYTWMRQNDTPENAEQYFHYSDEDMLTEYLNQKK